MAGYTKVVYEMKEVLSDLNGGKYLRRQVGDDPSSNKISMISLDKGQVVAT